MVILHYQFKELLHLKASKTHLLRFFNSLPHMSILGSSNSAANTDMMSKIWTSRDTII